MTQTVWIARHGNRIDFVNPNWFLTAERRYDPPLSEDGTIQAQQLGQRLKSEKIVHIFASPFLRTVQTANQVAEALDLPIKVEAGLSEWLNPEWMTIAPEKLTLAELHQQFPRIDLSYTSRVIAQYPENGTQALQRAAKTAKLLADEFPTDILLVGHGASVVGATMGLLDITVQPHIHVALCGLFKMVRHEQKWVMELNGDTSHLSQTEQVTRFN